MAIIFLTIISNKKNYSNLQQNISDLDFERICILQLYKNILFVLQCENWLDSSENITSKSLDSAGQITVFL